jgi:subtilisin
VKGGEKMKKIAAGVLVFCLLVSTYSIWAPKSERVIVVFHNTPDTSLISPYGQVNQVFHIIPAVVATLPESAVEALSRNKNVKYIESDSYNQFVTALDNAVDPTDEVIPWGVDRIDADLAWQYSTGKKVRVAVIDTGIDMDHPDLQANIHGGINTIAPSPQYPDPDNFDDDHGHGTFVAGIIAAVDNNIGVIGVAPNAWLYGVKVLNSGGAGYISDIIEGIEWCIDKDMQVINMSFGGLYSEALQDACDAAWDHGCILVACLGTSGVSYPAGYSSVIGVAATDRDDIQWYEYGEELELVAPGEGILSTVPGGGYAVMTGTSFGCPHVAGTAALVIARHPLYTNSVVRVILQRTAEDLGAPGWDPYYGYGMVDALEAVLV